MGIIPKITACFLILTFFVPNLALSQSTLWDLIIDIELLKNPINEGDIPVIYGVISDHAGKPVSDVEVKMRLGQYSIVTTSDENGTFYGMFSEFGGIPGNYIINVMATKDDEIGLASINFQLKGVLSASSHTARLLSTDEAKKYLHASPDKFENDPLGLTLYNYYQKLQQQLLDEIALQSKVDEEKRLLEEKRQIAIEFTNKIIEEKNPRAGTYSGYKYDQFVSNLDKSVRDIIVNQLNFTVSVFFEAQKAMEEVLANGGTFAEARKAYFEKATVSRELMESLTTLNNNTITENVTNSTTQINQTSTNSTQFTSVNSENQLQSVNGTVIDVGSTTGVIYLNVNGTIIKLLINGTKVIPLNSTE